MINSCNFWSTWSFQGDLGAIDDKYDVAISTACPPLDNIVCDTINTAQKCVEYLKKSGLGVATFIGLDKQQHWRNVYTRRINPYGNYSFSAERGCKPGRPYGVTFLFVVVGVIVEDGGEGSGLALHCRMTVSRGVTVRGARPLRCCSCCIKNWFDWCWIHGSFELGL